MCGALELDPDDPREQMVVNPSLVVEALSPSTEHYDDSWIGQTYRDDDIARVDPLGCELPLIAVYRDPLRSSESTRAI